MDKRAKILLVEDELIVATSIAQSLEKAGYEVSDIASSAEEALAAVERRSPDLILMDIRIKGPSDGVETARRLHEDIHRVPIIFLTAQADGSTVERAKATQPYGYLVKPVSPASLVSTIEVALHKSAIDRKLEQREEALRRVNQELEQFAYAAAHDLQEPLRNVGLATEILFLRLGGQFDDDTDNLLKTAMASSLKMQAMVRDLLAYARSLQVNEGTVVWADPHIVLSTVVKNLEIDIAEKHAKISWDQMPLLRVSELHLRQILQHLVQNSLTYSGDKPPCIHISVIARNEFVVVSVKDNGIGIPAQLHSRAFGLFKRLHDVGTSGTGIGLALCKRIVEHNGGKIWIESNPDEGITVLFSVPRFDIANSRANVERRPIH